MNQHSPIRYSESERVIQAAQDLIHAIDRGDFGICPLHIGPADDRAESSHLTALRITLIPFEANPGLTDFARRRGIARADAFRRQRPGCL